MKTNVSFLALALVLTAAIATPARAQVVIFSTGPIGIVGWDSRAVDCRIVRGAALANLATANVTFKPLKYGAIGLDCQVSAIMRVDPGFLNAFGLTFNNDNGLVGGVDQCFISTTIGAYPYQTGLPILVSGFSTAGQVFSGIQTANIALLDFLDVNNNTYSVSIYLSRASGATCNPIAFATFLEEVLQ